MNSGWMLTDSLNNNSDNTTTTVTSTQHNAEPSHNSNRTTQGWFLQWTRGWPWLSWTNKTTTTKHKPFYKTPTPTNSLTKTLPPNSKTNSSIFLKTSNSQEASVSKNTNNYTSAVQSHPSVMASPKFTKQVPPSDP